MYPLMILYCIDVSKKEEGIKWVFSSSHEKDVKMDAHGREYAN